MAQHELITLERWTGVLPRPQMAHALQIAREVASHLQEREFVEAVIAASEQQTSLPQAVQWRPSSLYQGDAGLALICSYLDACFPEEGWVIFAHDYLQSAVQDIVQGEGFSRLPIGLGGIGGVAFATWCVSQGGTRYRQLLSDLDASLLGRVDNTIQDISSDPRGISVWHYDLITGLTGLGAYLLCRGDQGGHRVALESILHFLVALSEEEGGIPHWHSPPDKLDQNMLKAFPEGNINCGLAHGVPGPLALMALSHGAGISVAGMPEAIRRVAKYLARHRLDDAWGINWPTAVSLTEGDKGKLLDFGSAHGPSRAAWCYGSPGIARSLWLAGEALDEAEYRSLAVEAMEAVYRRPIEARAIDSATFCHGVAGLLHITLRFAHDTRFPLFATAAAALADQLLAKYEPNRMLGYCSIDPDGVHIDHAGLLEGAPGVILVLLAAASNVEPTWDRMFLLS